MTRPGKNLGGGGGGGGGAGIEPRSVALGADTLPPRQRGGSKVLTSLSPGIVVFVLNHCSDLDTWNSVSNYGPRVEGNSAGTA